MINLDHVHFQRKTVIYFVQTFGNIYTIVPFCKHALRVFHAIAWLILLAHAQTNFPPVILTGIVFRSGVIIVLLLAATEVSKFIAMCDGQTPGNSTSLTQLNVDDQVITGDTNIADCFNQYFSFIHRLYKLSNNVQNINVDPMTFVTPTESSFHFSCISVQETFDALNQLNLKKSPGLDGISVRLLKDTSDVIAQPLANIFNLSLRTAIFPDEWKIAKVSPVFKEGNKTDCGNYRPISVISVVAKLFEGLVYNQLRTFIADNSILVEQQSGFRSQHSTETALLGSTNEWLYNMDSGLINGVLFLDLKKAFDTVDHEILLKKLHVKR